MTIEIGASIAQQARPKVSGKIEFARAQFWHLLEGRGDDPLFDVALEVLALEVAAEHRPGVDLLLAQAAALYLQSRAPLRQT